jgi:hypothetical protein
VVSRFANTVAGRWQWMEPWSVVSSTGTPCRSASRIATSASERSNHCRVSARSASLSRATSHSTVLSERPWVSRSTKLKTMAVTPGCDRYPGSRRTAASPSPEAKIFS